MKKIYTLVFALFVSISAFAQLPDGSIAPDFTATDIEGTEHNLYELLNDGKVVIIDLFATWCPPCWNYHQSHVLADAFDAYGPNGTDELYVFGIEGDGSTNLDCIYGPTGCNNSTFGDWTEGVPYPIINNSSIPPLYSLSYWPTIYIIYPTRVLNEMGQAPLNDIENWLANKPALGAGINPQVIQFDGYNGGKCADLWPDAPSYLISNMGEEEITSADITIDNNGDILYQESWSGSASSYSAIAEIQLPTQILTSNAVITLNMENINGDVNQSLTFESAITLEADNLVTVTVEADANTAADGTYYEIQDNDGQVLFQQNLEAGAGEKQYTHNLPTTGCHEIWVYDSGGNGLSTDMKMRDSQGNLLYSNDGFSSLDIQEFYVASLSNVNDLLTDVNMSLTPNPTSDILNVNLGLIESQDFRLTITSVSGQTVQSQILNNLSIGQNTSSIDVSDLSQGLFFLTISSDQGSLTKRFIKK